MSETPNTAAIEFTEDDIRNIVEALNSGLTPAEAAGVDQNSLEALYALGHRLYSVGEFKDAETAFKSLCLYDYRDPRFWMGFGAALQAQERFAMAAEVYGLAGLASKLGDPSPFYYAALCNLKLGNLEAAEEILGSVQALGTKGDPKDEALKAKAANLMAIVKAGMARKELAQSSEASK
jgi:type III secretion system low calcium response chaperone LcrH/SycD